MTQVQLHPSIIELICDDLKYQDKQNDPQYLMLNNKLREEKRINKVKKQMAKKAQKEREGKISKNDKVLKSKSKFSNKYSDRIASIREADKKAEQKMAQRKNKKSVTTKTESKKTTAQKRSNQEIREEMIKKLENSKLK